MRILLIVAIAVVVLAVNVEAQCFPEYRCGEWSGCSGGLQSRECVDKTCGRKSITERQLCGSSSCAPRILCDEWSVCFFTEKTSNLFGGTITFGGYRTRVCSDLNNCVESFTEEGSCQEAYELNFKTIIECEKEVLVAVDPKSNRQVAKIDLKAWESKRFEITFGSQKQSYCASCYNGQLDGGEERVDCGGECKECKEENPLPIGIFIYFSWGMSAIFLALFVVSMLAVEKAKKIRLR